MMAWFLWFSSFRCCENGYIPKKHYFFRYFLSHSYQERLELSSQYESYSYIKIGECAFLEDVLVFTSFGVIAFYDEIKSIRFKKVSNLNAVFVRFKDGTTYAFNISEAEYKGSDSLYVKAMDYCKQKVSSEEEP